ncbi:MAG: hypothetical protein ABIV51_14515 [Saprospiraceae bacterium]
MHSKFLRHLPIVLFFAVIVTSVKAQSGTVPTNCQEEYQQLFLERGANPIPDGIYKIIVSMRKSSYATCLVGKIAVKGNQLVRPLYILREDGTYVIASGELSDKSSDWDKRADLNINQGMSKELGNSDLNYTLFFTEFLGPISKRYKKAPPAANFNISGAKPAPMKKKTK